MYKLKTFSVEACKTSQGLLGERRVAFEWTLAKVKRKSKQLGNPER